MKAFVEVNKNTNFPINSDIQCAIDGLLYLGYDQSFRFDREDVDSMRI